MKVEFKDTQFDNSLCVKTSELRKIKNNEEEYSSIIMAIESFYDWRTFGEFRPDIPKMLFAAYKQARKNSGTIIFTCEYTCIEDMSFNLYLLSNDGLVQIWYKDESLDNADNI